MRIALLTNSKLSVPAIDFMAANKQLVAIGLPEREDKTEDADQIQHTASHYKVPVSFFSKAGLSAALTNWISSCKADVVFVFTFPFKIPSSVLDIPAKGFVNFHFGLLPQYRGADAIFWQIRNREKEGGISVHRMTNQLDKGPLFLVHKIPLSPLDTYGSHLLNLSMAAIPVTEKIINLLQAANPAVVAQDEGMAHIYSRPTLPDVTIDWSASAAQIIALTNATNPWNKGAVTFLNQYPLKIIAASAVPHTLPVITRRAPGTILISDERNICHVHCGLEELLNLDILYCNDSFITGSQFAKLGLTTGMQFERPA